MKRYKLILYLLIAVLAGMHIGASVAQYYGTIDSVEEGYAVVEIQVRNQLVFDVIPLTSFSLPVDEGDKVIVINK